MSGIERESGTSGHVVKATVGHVDDLEPGSMKMVHVGEQRVALIRTSGGVHAIDNACPHQGYGLVTGALSGETVTCQWHNWKYDVTTGRCLRGEEDVACHRVSIDDRGRITVEVEVPSAADRRRSLWPSLRRGLEADYVGQVARDSVRLLDAGATPAEIMAEAIAFTAPKTEDGVGHEMAMAADCLSLSEIRAGQDRALPLVQGLSGLAEVTRYRPAAPLPEPDPSIDLVAAIEAEDAAGAMASVLAKLEAGAGPAELRHQLLLAVSAHHLGYGHGIIYTQKAFELLDRLGWQRAPDILPYLAGRIVNTTREDTLPYMRAAMRAIESVDAGALAAAPDRTETGWDGESVVAAMLTATDAPIAAAATAVLSGAGVAGLLDAVSLAVSHRLLNHDLQVEFDLDQPFGWLDITHGLTTANAVRWAWRCDPGPHVARLALFATWLLFDTGRSERRHRAIGPARSTDEILQRFEPRGGSRSGADLGTAVLHRDARTAVSIALSAERSRASEALADAALADRAGSFIVTAHLIKTTQAAAQEAEATGSSLPLAAAARYLASPRLERFVARNVAESVDFIRTGRPPRR
jgi:nitrite reductase/ring-hydroxylating ferredoxin subunit